MPIKWLLASQSDDCLFWIRSCHRETSDIIAFKIKNGTSFHLPQLKGDDSKLGYRSPTVAVTPLRKSLKIMGRSWIKASSSHCADTATADDLVMQGMLIFETFAPLPLNLMIFSGTALSRMLIQHAAISTPACMLIGEGADITQRILQTPVNNGIPRQLNRLIISQSSRLITFPSGGSFSSNFDRQRPAEHLLYTHDDK